MSVIFEITKKSFFSALSELSSSFDVYVPVINSDDKKEMALFSDAIATETIELDGIRPAANVKSFFFKSHVQVASYPEPQPLTETKKRLLVGIKACDIYSLRILDTVFLDEKNARCNDVFYKELRENTVILTSDCSDVPSTCSCMLLGLKPFCLSDDPAIALNITVNGDTIIIEERNKELIDTALFSSAKSGTPAESITKTRNTRRAAAEEAVNANVEKFKVPPSAYQKLLVEKRYDKKWQEISSTCVECHGCLHGCPTCHCYLLLDVEKEKDSFERYRVWDTCYYRGYSLMAGGLTPRPDFIKRFQNRFYHKYDWFITNHNMPACSGCGRCIETCMGKIDFREVFEKLNG